MKNFSTWLLACFMVMFWAFRAIVTLMAELHQDFGGIVPLNKTLEIILLFVVLVCIVLVVKRKMVGALMYLLSYGIYFGTDILKNINTIIEMEGQLPATIFMNLFVSFIGLILPIAVLLDMLVDRNRKNNPKDKKTDWFYKNEKFDRQLDERADKNNYRTL
ncbi:MAG: hypothetical protein ACLTKT_05475 [Clostridia bacterium]|nr:hypothetical protein [Clostridium sp.]MBS6251882.1 hypothetical protein [Clostridium sp.]